MPALQATVELLEIFFHEHPWTARSWKLECIEEVGNLPGAQKVQTHMCRFGMESHVDKIDGEKGPVMKPTGFMTNSWCIASELDRQCKRDHKHVQLVGGERHRLQFTRDCYARQYTRESANRKCTMQAIKHPLQHCRGHSCSASLSRWTRRDPLTRFAGHWEDGPNIG